MSLKPLCIIPARGGSKRFPRKNIALLNGKPLISYAIEVAQKSGIFDTVCVSSEDEEILGIAKEGGADVVLRRPDEFATDTSQIKHVCKHLLEHFSSEGREYDAFAVLIPVSPLRTTEDIIKTYEMLQARDVNCVMSVVPFVQPPQHALCVQGDTIESYFDMKTYKRSQELQQLYHHDGTIIFMKTKPFLKREEFYGEKVVPYFVHHERSVDIDSPIDLAWAEFLLSRMANQSDSY
ncbi:acylneuraminate cytidylyltransferase family protein [Patescibacteria group bacterium]|nr:acylneuraminate cytidylyltransferase family protein [Patescibacteria group bacterium]